MRKIEKLKHVVNNLREHDLKKAFVIAISGDIVFSTEIELKKYTKDGPVSMAYIEKLDKFVINEGAKAPYWFKIRRAEENFAGYSRAGDDYILSFKQCKILLTEDGGKGLDYAFGVKEIQGYFRDKEQF